MTRRNSIGNYTKLIYSKRLPPYWRGPIAVQDLSEPTGIPLVFNPLYDDGEFDGWGYYGEHFIGLPGLEARADREEILVAPLNFERPENLTWQSPKAGKWVTSTHSDVADSAPAATPGTTGAQPSRSVLIREDGWYLQAGNE